MSRYTPIGSADGSSRGVAGFSSSSYPPRRSAPATSSREMDAAFDGSDGSDEDDSDDDDTPLARRSPGNGDRTSPGSSGNASRANVGGSSRVLFDAFDEDEARRQGGDESGSFLLPDVDNPLRTQGIVAGSSSSPLAAAAGPEGASYDFDRDYFLPPPGSPPPDAYPENYLPTGPTPLTTTPAYPRSHGAPSASSRFLGSILPTHFRRSAARPSAPRGSDGVFANIAAKPEIERVRGEGGEEDGVDGENGLVMAEFAQKEGPPSYNSALRDAVPPYWEHSVVTPTSYGPLGSFSGSGDDLLLDGLPIGNIFGFAWNCLVSFSFQFVGFLLTYVLHTTHAAKYGSRAGLGATLIQYGLYLRQRADDYLESDSESPNEAMCVDAFEFTVPCPVDPATAASSSVAAAVKATATVFSDLASPTPTPVPTTLDQMPPYLTYGEKFQWMHDHNMTLPNGELGINGSTMEEISRANEWMSFVLMSVGWFVLLTSLGGYWRVKRFEASLAASTAAPTNNADGNPISQPSPSAFFLPQTVTEWFTSSRPSPDDDEIATSTGSNRSSGSGIRGAFQRAGQGIRDIAGGARERIERVRIGRRGRHERVREEDEDDEELML